MIKFVRRCYPCNRHKKIILSVEYDDNMYMQITEDKLILTARPNRASSTVVSQVFSIKCPKCSKTGAFSILNR